MSDSDRTPAQPSLLPPAFVARTLFVLGAAAAFVLSARLAPLFLLVFGAIVVAVILRSIADPVSKWTPLKGGLAVLAAVLVVLGVIGGVSYLFGRQVSEQFNALSQQVPHAWDVLQARLSATPIGAKVLEQLKAAAGQADKVFALAPKFALGFASGVTTLVLVLVAGVFLAIHPAQSRDGVLTLVPKPRRERLRYVMDCCGRALKGWFKAQLVSMTLVGSLVGLGLWPLGVPSPLALGLFAGVAQFVPVVGPIVSAIPALILAATNGPQQAGLTLLLFVAVSQLESNFITPMVQKNVASLPVVFGIFAVVGFGGLLGPLGVLFATPMALTLYTVVTLLYRQDVLGDDVRAPGEPPASRG
ncbi:MAG: AI-2E family transporter [Caulobacteraceae bacterium]|nr:AI-2E family transporter [Caulobacter sp.]